MAKDQIWTHPRNQWLSYSIVSIGLLKETMEQSYMSIMFIIVNKKMRIAFIMV